MLLSCRVRTDLAADAFADADFQRALADAAGGIADFYAERAKDPGVEAPVTSHAPAGSRAVAGDGPTRGAILPAGFDKTDADEDPAGQLRAVLESADATQRASGEGAPVITDAVQVALDRAAAGTLDEGGARVLQVALDRAADVAVGPGGGGLLAVATVAGRGEAALDAVLPANGARPVRRERRNPFGRLAGLRISKKNYDRRRAWRFRKNFQRWMPHLTAWDATLRLIAAEARIRRRFKPGFVLDDELLGLTTSTPSGTSVVYLHPDRFEQVIKAHRDRPIAIAAYLHGVACHELTHLDGRMGQGHSEEFVAAREDLGHATGHLLPALAVLVQRVLGLPVKPTADQRRIATLEKQLARAREQKAAGRKVTAQVERLERELVEARTALELAQSESAAARAACDQRCATCACAAEAADPAVRVVDAAVSAMLVAPPSGVEAAEVAAFARRHRARLVGLVRERLAGRRGA